MTTPTKFTPVPRAFKAFNMAYEARVLPRDEHGQPEPGAYERFERFWDQVERDLIAPDRGKSYIQGLKEGKRIQRDAQLSRTLSIIAMGLAVAAILLRLGAHFGWF